jgi:prepilin-type N-terminal cleavage/methylation domain-containing protein
MSTSPRGKGFTLVEIAVALAIFALSAVGLSQGFLNILMVRALTTKPTNEQNEIYTLKQIVFSQSSPVPLKNGGVFTSVTGEKVRWNAAVHPTRVENLYRIESQCLWPDQRQKKWIFHLWIPHWGKNKGTEKDTGRMKRT